METITWEKPRCSFCDNSAVEWSDEDEPLCSSHQEEYDLWWESIHGRILSGKIPADMEDV